ncbi:hypothetical protein NHX12_026335 [Muraenolepis orangiensis]|uniref:Uncharacterized protein n=1 Tax=Muraenolepis orangiensis TaxID=630683 RepID=A0A9Q0EHB4_9TELE|nr:hypothetical protein NHX12_026335 [Muraenolepis orangiensis]
MGGGGRRERMRVRMGGRREEGEDEGEDGGRREEGEDEGEDGMGGGGRRERMGVRMGEAHVKDEPVKVRQRYTKHPRYETARRRDVRWTGVPFKELFCRLIFYLSEL